MPSPSSRHRFPWIVRACAAGLGASALSAIVGTALYLQDPGSATMNWDFLAPAIVLFALVGGLSLGLGLGGGMVLARGRAHNPRAGRLVAGAAAGGLLASIAPGILGIAGFGSLHGPYLGTVNIVGCSLLCAATFVALWAPRLFDHGPRRAAARITLASVAAIVTALSFAALAGTLIEVLDLQPSFRWLRATSRCMGLTTFAVVAGALLGTIYGAFIGAATSVYGSLAAVVGSRPRPRA